MPELEKREYSYTGEPQTPAPEGQLDFSQEGQEPETPEALRITDEEKDRIDSYSATMGRYDALVRVLGKGRGQRIFSYEEANRVKDKIDKNIAERAAVPPRGPSTEELVELMKSTNTSGPDGPPAESTDQAA